MLCLRYFQVVRAFAGEVAHARPPRLTARVNPTIDDFPITHTSDVQHRTEYSRVDPCGQPWTGPFLSWPACLVYPHPHQRLLAVGVHRHDDVRVISMSNRFDHARFRRRVYLDCHLGRPNHEQYIRKVLDVKDDLLLRSINSCIQDTLVISQILGVRLDRDNTRLQPAAITTLDLDTRNVRAIAR